MQDRRQRFWQEQIGIADTPDQSIDIDRKIRDLPFLLRRLQDQQDLLAATQAEAGDQRVAAARDALGHSLGQTQFLALAIGMQARAIG